jgi:hypothetical protein
MVLLTEFCQNVADIHCGRIAQIHASIVNGFSTASSTGRNQWMPVKTRLVTDTSPTCRQ